MTSSPKAGGREAQNEPSCLQLLGFLPKLVTTLKKGSVESFSRNKPICLNESNGDVELLKRPIYWPEAQSCRRRMLCPARNRKLRDFSKIYVSSFSRGSGQCGG